MNFLKYSILRLGIMVAAFYASYYFGVGIIFAGLFAIMIAFAIPYLLFPRLHTAASADLQGWLSKRKPRTNKAEEETRNFEDQYVDAKKREEGLDF